MRWSFALIPPKVPVLNLIGLQAASARTTSGYSCGRLRLRSTLRRLTRVLEKFPLLERERPDLFDPERFELLERVPFGPVLDNNFFPERVFIIRSFLVLLLTESVFCLEFFFNFLTFVEWAGQLFLC